MKHIYPQLYMPNDSKVLLFILDGVGGVPHPQHGGQTELEAANCPNFDQLAAEGVCGLHDPVAPGVTPGSGPGHLGVFGYDPLELLIGRGVPEALGSGIELKPDDVAVRGNFCAVKDGLITDRRAYRPPTEQCVRLCKRLAACGVEGLSVAVFPVKEHRFLLKLSGDALAIEVSETDPQRTGEPIPPARPLVPTAARTAEAVNAFVNRATEALADEPVIRPDGVPDEDECYGMLLRGFGRRPTLTTLSDTYGIRCAAVASYPMYRGVAELVGMRVLDIPEPGHLSEQLGVLRDAWSDYDLFFLHLKDTDKAGEDGKFDRKVAAIEAADAVIPELRALDPAVICVTGDHATPSAMKMHSWHPVPVVIWSRQCGADGVSEFHERACAAGGLGRMRAIEIMPQLMANAGRLDKYGA